MVGAAPLRNPTRSYLWTNHSTTVAGALVKLTGRVTYGTARAPVRYQVVKLQVRTSTTWRTVATRRTWRTGYIAFGVRPAVSTAYRLVFAGGPSLLASRSAAVGVRVVPRATVTGTTGSAAPATTSNTVVASSPSARASKVIALAAAQTGKWYRYGAAGPNYFDCSGLTMYVFRSVGIALPHKANSQKYYGRAVSRAAALPGDLVIFLDGGWGYHVGIYAGGGYMYDSPHPGATVGKRKIWNANVVFRRLL